MNKAAILSAITAILLPALAWGQTPMKEYYSDGVLKVDWYSEFNDNELTRKEYYPDGTLMNEARYTDNLIDGVYRAYDRNGSLLAEINYDRGSEHGPYKEYSLEGLLLKEGNYNYGKFDGLQRTFDNLGNLYQEIDFKDSIQNGVAKTYYPNGQLKEELYYVNGELSGPAKFYDERGRLKAESQYARNLRDGVTKEYYENGRVRTVMNFVYDMLDGEYIEYYEDQQIKLRDIIVSGKVVEREVYDERGSLQGDLSFDSTGRSKAVKAALSIRDRLPGTLKKLSREAAVIILSLFFLTVGVFIGTVIHASQNRDQQVNFRALSQMENINTRKEYNTLNEESEKMYRGLVETVKSGIFMADANGKLFYVNNTFAQIFGFQTKQEVIGMNLNTEFRSVEHSERQLLKMMGETNEIQNFQFKYRLKNNEVVALSVNANRIFDETGKPIGIQGMVLDITEKKHLEEAIMNEKKKMEAILAFFENIDGIRELEKLIEFGIDGIAAILEARTCLILMAEKESEMFVVKGDKGLGGVLPHEIVVDRQDPVYGPVIISKQPLYVENIEYDERFGELKKPAYLGRSFMVLPLEHADQVNGLIVVSNKMSQVNMDPPFNETDWKILAMIAGKVSNALENIRIYEDLNVQTVIDPITKIYNYRLLSDSLDREIQRYKREKSEFYIFMMDIDDFKSYNDTFGHLEGDELLTGLGAILNAQVRKTDIVCRYAGDEFCIVLANTNLAGAITPAEKIIRAVEAAQFKRTVTVSIGIAGYEEEMTKKELIAKADKALYQAKQQGKNKYVISC